jgi:25S rRNA (uracil2634-N3)-methyltransferase
MSKSQTKKARRQSKRDGAKKQAAFQKKTAKGGSTPYNPSRPQQKKKKQKPDMSVSATTQASQQHAVPFGEYDHILLVGEGDFSFARSLAIAHGCSNVTATSYDSASVVEEKYPNFSETRDELTGLTPPVPLHHAIDATKLSSYKQLKCQRDPDEEGEQGTEGMGWDTIAFMFPHTGGLSTDVNRQVRSNQALLVSFFKSCLETSTPGKRLQILAHQKVGKKRTEFLKMGGRIIVTLFEGEPYTLWNIRDLARHVGLKCVESWRFDASQYPGYAHVRTLGAIEGGGAWRGEDRSARCYVFQKVALQPDSEEEGELEKIFGGKKVAAKEDGEEKGEGDEKKVVEKKTERENRLERQFEKKGSKKRARGEDSDDE